MLGRRFILFAIVCCSAILGGGNVTAAGDVPVFDDRAGEAFFEAKIRPVLVANCYECHSAAAAERGKLKGGLALDTREAWMRGGESGPAIVPGKPGESLLLEALKFDGLEMPPTERLSAAVVADFEKWIAMGAPDPRSGPAAAVRRGMSIADGRKFWSFMPPRHVAPPAVRRIDWPRDDIDRYILAAQESRGLTPAADADPRVLVRRLYFDLIGLPPTAEELEEFLASLALSPYPLVSPSFVQQRGGEEAIRGGGDGEVKRGGEGEMRGGGELGDDPYERLVDKLLASPHFGERWGRHWLDAARYADSNGRDRNVYFYHAWRYRNYVIAAFNHDKPYDEFIREQIAGDLLPADTPAEADEHRIAGGFLALGAKAFEESKPEVFRMDVIDEQMETIGRTVLGLSIGCARCHDHKFDPIPTADYYALAGILRSSEPLYGYGPKGIKSNVHAHSGLHAIGPEAQSLGPQGVAYLARLQELTLAQNTARSDRYRVVRVVAAKKLDLAKPGADKAALEQEIAKLEGEIKAWDATVKAAEDALQAAMDSAPPQPGWAMGVRDRAAPENCRIHIRGETTNLGEIVPRGVLQVVGSAPVQIAPTHSGRLELADWLAARDNPLTARVYVNRIWQHLFGEGLVATPDDFGVNGGRPLHPELLDHLAMRFIDDGWSTKQLIRAIVLSRTYRQASSNSAADNADAPDADNVYLSRMKPRRLEVEAFRDAIKSVAGTLDPTPPTAKQEFLAQYNPYREDEYRTFKPLFEPRDIEGSHRSVYLPVVRGVLPPMFGLFDFASPERPVARRDESIVPAQSLFLMNNPWVEAESRHAARRLLEDETLADDEARIDRLYRRAFGRAPDAAELRRAAAYVAEPESLLAGSSPAAPPAAEQLRVERWTSFCQAVFASAEFQTVR